MPRESEMRGPVRQTNEKHPRTKVEFDSGVLRTNTPDSIRRGCLGKAWHYWPRLELERAVLAFGDLLRGELPTHDLAIGDGVGVALGRGEVEPLVGLDNIFLHALRPGSRRLRVRLREMISLIGGLGVPLRRLACLPRRPVRCNRVGPIRPARAGLPFIGGLCANHCAALRHVSSLTPRPLAYITATLNLCERESRLGRFQDTRRKRPCRSWRRPDRDRKKPILFCAEATPFSAAWR